MFAIRRAATYFRVQSLPGPEESHLREWVQKVGSFRSNLL